MSRLVAQKSRKEFRKEIKKRNIVQKYYAKRKATFLFIIFSFLKGFSELDGVTIVLKSNTVQKIKITKLLKKYLIMMLLNLKNNLTTINLDRENKI